ncbi:MAG TPA: hypothetical protein VF469_26685 [Kofleriaceae bacterium]
MDLESTGGDMEIALEPAAAEDIHEYSFYLAGAYVVETYQVGQYKLWLPDLMSVDKRKRWDSGEVVPDQECVIVNCNYVIDLDDNATRKEIAGGHLVLATIDGIKLTSLSTNMVEALSLPARVAISEELWNRIPVEARPLPRQRDQAYRLQVVVRFTETAEDIVRRAFIGFHVQVVADAGDGRKQVRFLSWIDSDRGVYLVDLTDPMFDPVSRGHSTISADSEPGDEGALFVALDSLSSLPDLDIPKVPFGAQDGGAEVTRLTPKHRRNGKHRRLEVRP